MRPSRKPFTWPSPETLAILLAAVLLSTFLAPRAAIPEKLPEPSRLKAVQILILPGPDETGARLHLRKLRDAGFDTIILRAFHLAGDRPHPQAASAVTAATEGVYFPTGRAPVVMDLVTPFVRICREEGLRPFAWMVTRRARFGNPNLSRDRVYSGTGDPIVPTEELDILDPASRDYLAGLFQDLAATGVEGILLQDDLSLRMSEGFSAAALDRYAGETGDPVPPYRHLGTVREEGRIRFTATPAFDRWAAWKTRQILETAARLQEAVLTVSPGTVLVMNQMYETLTDPDNGRRWLSQDLGATLRDGPPYAALMLYHLQMQEELGLELPDTLGLLEDALGSLSVKVRHRSRVVLKFQTLDWKTGRPVDPGDLLSVFMTAWGGGWSVAFVPQPTEEQIQRLSPVLGGM